MKSHLFNLKASWFIEINPGSIMLINFFDGLGHRQTTVCSTWYDVLREMSYHGLEVRNLKRVLSYLGKTIPAPFYESSIVFEHNGRFVKRFPNLFGLKGFKYYFIPSRKVVVISD